MEIKINEVIRSKRHRINVSQEVLAESLGVTVQAVSKWETGLSYPDISLLPLIAEYFGISMDGLFFGEEFSDAGSEAEAPRVFEMGEIPDDDRLRVVQCLGKKVLCRDEYSKEDKIKLVIPKIDDKAINVEVWGNAGIEGDISGNATAGGALACGDVGGNAVAGNNVNCSDVGGNVNAGHGVTCSDIGGNARAGQNITCSDIGGDAEAGKTIIRINEKGKTNNE